MSCLPWIIENKGQHAGKSIGLQNKQAFIQKSLQCLPTDHLETIEYVQGNKNIEADCSVYIFAGNDYRLYLRKNTMLLIAKPNTLVSSWSID
jgi:hypothetical protein